MHTLLPCRTFKSDYVYHDQQGSDIYTAIPQVTLNEPRVCRCKFSVRDGVGDKVYADSKTNAILPINRLSCLVLCKYIQSDLRLKLLLLFRTDNHRIYHNNGRLSAQ